MSRDKVRPALLRRSGMQCYGGVFYGCHVPPQTRRVTRTRGLTAPSESAPGRAASAPQVARRQRPRVGLLVVVAEEEGMSARLCKEVRGSLPVSSGGPQVGER